MVVQNFVFRENWVGSNVVAGMKTTISPFLTQPGSAVWSQKAFKSNMELFKLHFSFQSIRTTEVILLSLLSYIINCCMRAKE